MLKLLLLFSALALTASPVATQIIPTCNCEYQDFARWNPGDATISEKIRGPVYAPTPIPAPTPLAKTTPATSNNAPALYQEVLAIHNEKRAKHHAGPLTWDTTVAVAADRWASNCVFRHESNSPYGENLYMSSNPSMDHKTALKDAVSRWYAEVGQYNWSTPGFSMATGHFSAIVWLRTRVLGCSAKSCPGMTIVVCKYKEPGNVIGQFDSNVLRP